MVKVFSLEPGVWSVAYDVYQVLSGTNAWSPTGTGSSGLTVPASTTIVTANTTSTSSGTTGWWVLSVLAPAVITIAYGGASTIACGGNSFYITPYNPNLVPGNPLMSEIRLQKRRYHDDQKNALDRPSEEKEMSKADSPVLVTLPPRSSRGVSRVSSSKKGENLSQLVA